jgi:predicted metal-binding membrane protein
MDQPVGRLEGLLRRDRAIALAALAALTLLAWIITVRAARTMSSMEHMTSGMGQAIAMPGSAGWDPTDLLGLFSMWAVMMVAMMVPSVAPIVILVLGVLRRRHASRLPFGPTAAFLGGYVLVWAGFSLVATLAQWWLHSVALLSADAMRATPVVGGLLLLAAGIFQWTPLKAACLNHCRSPFHFFSTQWREGVRGALVMGLRHGSWCLGCCWLLMSLLFVAGVMNLAWVAALAILVLLEKVAPAGPALGRAFGVGLGVWGVWLLAGGTWG